jgi:L-lysine 6-transaminase
MLVETHSTISASEVHPTIRKYMLGDGFPLVLDMQKSQGIYLHDRLQDKRYVDFFTFFASNPLGMNHPKLRYDEEFKERLMEAALNKISNSDVFTEYMARFVDTFGRVGIPSYLPHLFVIDGGALAVENALKTAFDWKVRKNFQKGYRYEKGHKVLHFEQAFHGRSGYTMSLTNTDPNKVALFPKFDWCRVTNPKANVPLTAQNLPAIIQHEKLAIAQIKQHIAENPDDIAALIIEPIQAEGGDNHFRPEFFHSLRHLADENEFLLIFDEVQTGVGLTGTFWMHEQIGVQPDILAFGKKMQTCGILASDRILEVQDNVFQKPSRINSTWGSNLTDMVRADRILEVIEEDMLLKNAEIVGNHLYSQIEALANEFDVITNPRGRGLMCAFDLPSSTLRNRLHEQCYENGLIILGCGEKTIRFRPALTINEQGINEGLDILSHSLHEIM